MLEIEAAMQSSLKDEIRSRPFTYYDSRLKNKFNEISFYTYSNNGLPNLC